MSDTLHDLQAPCLDVKGLCELIGMSEDYVSAHISPKADPSEYWEHERFGRNVRFTASQVLAILEKHRAAAAGGGAEVLSLVDDSAFEKALSRRERDKAA